MTGATVNASRYPTTQKTTSQVYFEQCFKSCWNSYKDRLVTTDIIKSLNKMIITVTSYPEHFPSTYTKWDTMSTWISSVKSSTISQARDISLMPHIIVARITRHTPKRVQQHKQTWDTTHVGSVEPLVIYNDNNKGTKVNKNLCHREYWRTHQINHAISAVNKISHQCTTIKINIPKLCTQ